VATVTKAWVENLSAKNLDKIVALAGYNTSVRCLSVDLDRWLNAGIRKGGRKSTKEFIWGSLFWPYFTLYASMVYVVHEGFVELQVGDTKLDAARKKVDIDALRRFRNATFHFQPHFRNPKHQAMLENGLSHIRALDDRQDFLVTKMVRFGWKNPHAETSVNFHDRANAAGS
jgi:hypothetical protein